MAEALPETEGFSGLKKVADAIRTGEDSDVICQGFKKFVEIYDIHYDAKKTS